MARVHGTLLKWNDERGFGFIALPHGGPELFVHISAFPRDGTRPAIGELISFEIASASDGKQRATGVQRPRRSPDPRSPDPRRSDPRRSGQRTAWTPASLALVAVCMGLVYAYLRGAAPDPAQVASPAPAARIPRAAQAGFVCDGRNRCSQMTSCAEATYFLRNCPDPQMDGNHDGIPCEQQWCN